MAFDSARGRVVLFGGNDGTMRADTWEWNGVAWIPQIFASGPAARLGHAMAFDSARGKVILFGGYVGPGVYAADTWEWDGTSWTQALPPLTPPGRGFHALAFDSIRSRTILFGGSYSNGAIGIFLADTWEWDGLTWQLKSSVGPAPRDNHAMAFGATGRVLLTGGWNGTIQGVDLSWDGSSWINENNGGSIYRYGHSMAFDSLRGRMVAFGGSGYQNDTKELIQPAGSGTSYGTGCGTPHLSLSADPTAQPRVGALARALVTNMPTPAAAMMVGWSNSNFGPFNLPVSLASLGMTGCELLQSTDLFGLPVSTTSSSTGDFLLGIPPNPAAAGLHIYLQALAYAPGAPGDFVVSNGLDWTIGP